MSQQSCTAVTVKFNDLAVADFFDRQIDLGRRPEEFARVWIHTHPGDSAQPGLTDEKTFSRVFGKCDWAVMAILARGGESYARLGFNTGPKTDVEIRTEVDRSGPFAGSDHSAWLEEYKANVSEEASLLTASPTRPPLRRPVPLGPAGLRSGVLVNAADSFQLQRGERHE